MSDLLDQQDDLDQSATGATPTEDIVDGREDTTVDLRVAQAEALAKARGETSVDSTGDKVDEITEQPDRLRDEQGKFAKASDKPDDTGNQQDKTDDKRDDASNEAASHLPAPGNWSADKNEMWSTLAPETQEYVATLMQHDRANISRLGQDASNAAPWNQLLQDHQGTFANYEQAPHETVAGLLRLSENLNNNPEDTIKELISAYKLDPSSLLGQPQPQNQQQDQYDEFNDLPVDPEITALRGQIDELKQSLGSVTGFLSQQEQQEDRRTQEYAQQQELSASNFVEEFAARPENADFEDLHEDIQVAINMVAAKNPSAAAEDIMNEAIEIARWSNPISRARLQRESALKINADQQTQSEQKAKATAKAVAAAKSAGAAHVNGQMSGRPPPMSLLESQKAALAKARSAMN